MLNAPQPNRRVPPWLVLAGLLALSVVPIGAGLWRLHQLASDPVVTADNARFVNNPVPIVVHMVSALLYLFFGAFQVAQVTRQKSLPWHRVAGRAVAPLGILSGVSGVWVTIAYWTLTRDGPVLFGLRFVVGTAMAGFILWGVVRVLRRDVAGHRAWMLRGYALGISGGTQFFTHLPWLVVGEMPGPLGSTLAMAAGWVINLVVVELHLRSGVHATSAPHFAVARAVG